MKINTKISQDDYITLMQTLAKKRPWYYIGMFYFIVFVVMAVYNFATSSIRESLISLAPGAFLIIAFGLYLPYVRKKAWTKLYASNARLQENIEWDFDNNILRLTAESFYAEKNLNKAHKILELKSWFLVYEDKVVANLLPKKDMTANQVTSVREIFHGLDSGVTKKLL
jgi:hypothetical protein